jgi:hypothetical protein
MEETRMGFHITYCPLCGAEHSDIEKLTEREAVETCLEFDLSDDERAKHLEAVSQVRQIEERSQQALERLERSGKEFNNRVKEILEKK